ncbi:MAG: tyrosine-protein phosphatase [Terriglobia bacterium]
MVDIHSHILPGVDDGARTLEEAVGMVQIAADDGTTCIVATPHCNDRYPYSLEQNRRLLSELSAAVGTRMGLALGCDFHLSYENLQALLAGNRTYTINQGPYLLVEFTDYAIPPQLADTLHQLRLQGLIPIVTHPERNPLLQRGLGLLGKLIAMGCPVQVTASSLLGRFGSPARQSVEELLRRQMVHLVASDAHDTEHRPPRLSAACADVARNFGRERADALFRDNPRAVVEGNALPYFPEPVARERKRRFSFFRR